jgi:hypothetical protein
MHRTQKKYTDDIIRRFDMSDATRTEVPQNAWTVLVKVGEIRVKCRCLAVENCTMCTQVYPWISIEWSKLWHRI